MTSAVGSILVLGGGTSGFLAALAVRTHLPHIDVRLIRSPELGIIGVGEGTTAAVPRLLHASLQIDVAEFYREVNPMWKLGVKFLWGPREVFHYSFGRQMTGALPSVRKPLGYFCRESVSCSGIEAALMEHDRVFVRHPQGGFPVIAQTHAYHLENASFVAYLERLAIARGVTVIDDTVSAVTTDQRGIASLGFVSGRKERADLYIDCSGFRSELLGVALREPFVSFATSLLCDRACVGGWARSPGERIQPYTVAETMDAGWCWRIDHEHAVHRGYVYSSAFLTDCSAEEELRRRNPRIQATRIVRFRSGRYQRGWVKNVCAIGNAFGFVEPLEATAIAAIGESAMAFVCVLAANECTVTESTRSRYNSHFGRYWDAIRAFLAVHYKYNTRLDTEFWRAARRGVELAGAEAVCDFYKENGPSVVWEQSLIDPVDPFGLEGYLTLLVGQRVPHDGRYVPTMHEQASMQRLRAQFCNEARRGYSVEEALGMIRHPEWRWHAGFFCDDHTNSLHPSVIAR